MSGELEAAGALTTAGLAAGAIEGRPPGTPGEGVCLNCGAQLTGRYCSECGQAAHSHRTLAHVMEEFLHGIFHFDAKVWRTLPMLIGRPGTLTRNYVYGKRARYISPLAMFLFTIFLMFFVFESVDVDLFHADTTPQDRAEIASSLTELQADIREAEADIAAERAERGDAPLTPAQRAADASKDRALALSREGARRLEQQLERMDAAAARAANTQGAPAAGQSNPGAGAAPGSAPEAGVAPGADAVPGVTPGAPEAEQTWQEELSEAARNGDLNVGTGFPELDARIVHSLQNPDLALYKVQQAASAFAFLLVPISLPFMWLLFIWKRGITAYDHIAFTLYSLSFASIVFVFVALCSKMPSIEWLAAMAVSIGMPLHMFFHLKGAYALGWWSAIWRTTFLLLFAILSLCIFVFTIVLLGLGG